MLKCKVEQNGSNAVVTVSGRVDESTQSELNSLSPQLGDAIQSITINCKGIESLNSMGISYWLDFWAARAKLKPVTLVECSLAFLQFMALIPPRQMRLETGYISLACPSCKKRIEFSLSSSSPHAPTSCPHCQKGTGLEDDFEDISDLFISA